MRKLALAGILCLAVAAPAAALAHDPIVVDLCMGDAPTGNDCVTIATDAELENGVVVEVDGDDETSRPDGYSDGYAAVEVTTDGASVYCEDTGGYNHSDFHDPLHTDDHNGTNEACGP